MNNLQILSFSILAGLTILQEFDLIISNPYLAVGLGIIVLENKED